MIIMSQCVWAIQKIPCDHISIHCSGDPRDRLRSTAYAAFQPITVQPAHPVWVTDTPEGIAVLTLTCVLAAMLLLLPLLCLTKKRGWHCFKTKYKTHTFLLSRAKIINIINMDRDKTRNVLSDLANWWAKCVYII